MILLDTHALIWWKAGERLSARASRAIAVAELIFLSPISFWEVGMLLARGLFTIDRDPLAWVGDLVSEERVRVAPLTPQAAMNAGALSLGSLLRDPADAMICCTAIELGVPLVTKDRKIKDFAGSTKRLKVIW